MTIYIEDMSVGQVAEYGKTITDADIILFAGVTGDNNPVHIDQEYAEKTPFGTRIAHGMLTASLISTVLGTRLPGPGTIYLSQSAKFKAPVKIGDTVQVRVSVKDIDLNRKRVTLETNCYVAGKLVLEGEALAIAPSKPTA
ncbi:MaoC family dehydratase [Chitinivorax sp. PXF-14]|uniref:MaoC family dehydratase n=1 Tax=Chitinivorax sp. PXF-14 TaxID=3230488 RepID=UPI003466087E